MSVDSLEEAWNLWCDVAAEYAEGTKTEEDLFAILKAVYDLGWSDRGRSINCEY